MRLKDRALIGPQVVQLDLTDACTNNCLGCWARSPMLQDEDHYDTLEKGALDMPFVRALLPRLVELRVRELFLGGGGDPLCHPDLVEVVRLAKQHGLSVTLNTNLTVADGALLERLADAGLDLLIVSLWAGTGETYSRLHPNKTAATFAHLTQLLKHLAALKRARPGPRVKLYHVVSALNFEEIPLMVEHGRHVGAEEVELAVLDPIPRRTDHFTLSHKQIVRVFEILDALPAGDTPFVHTELFRRRLHNIDATKGVFDNGIVASIPCAAGWFYSRVTTVGQVHACLKAHRVAAGDLREHDFAAVWFGDGMKTFRRHTLKLDYHDPWLQNIGHDIDFALPGCFRICDNLGHNQHIMKLDGGLTEIESDVLAAMETAARSGAALHEIEDVYRAHLAETEAAATPFSPPVKTAPAGLTLHGDDALIHEPAGGEPWVEVLAALADLPPAAPIRVPITLANCARVDRILALVRVRTGRAVDPAWAPWRPRPLTDLHRRWPATLARAAELAAAENVILELDAADWREALWKIAGAAGGANDAELERALGALTGVATIGPRTFHLDVTNRCEADCAYCWFHSPLSEARTDPHRLTDANRDAAMPWDMFERLADDLVALETSEDIVLSGKGDPLSHPRIADMVRALKTRGLAVTLFTGGHGLTDAILDALIEAKLDLLYVSLSATDEATYARLHEKLSPATFGRTVAAVRRLLDRRRAAGQNQPRVVLVDVITARNHAQVVDFAHLAADLGVDHVRYQLAAIEDYNTELALDDQARAALPERLSEARRIAEAASVDVIANIEFQTGEHGEGADWTGDRYARLGCLAGYVFGRAWADGTLSFCCAPRPIGNLNERSLADWWRSDEYDRVRLAAARLGAHRDFPLVDGTPLWTDVCRRCPNYEGIERLRTVLTELDLLDRLP
jgi:MoaA/NifB/PqqE/SkfB family radical SAM enzyme